MMDYFLTVPGGRKLLEQYTGLTAWWKRIAERKSMQYTKPTT
ncbi:hypothetical protein [Rhizobium sp. SEMIA 4085]|nr:hypothetical protein [Rhizobium sp. SEMIA 4085]